LKQKKTEGEPALFAADVWLSGTTKSETLKLLNVKLARNFSRLLKQPAERRAATKFNEEIQLKRSANGAKIKLKGSARMEIKTLNKKAIC
jgi:hypothetical protein